MSDPDKRKKPGLAKTKEIFRTPANPTTWKPTPRQMEIYLEICRGVPWWQMSKRLKCATKQLRALCRYIDEFLVNERISDIRLDRERVSQKLEAIYCESMESFRVSKNPTKTIEKTTGRGGGEPVETAKERVTEQPAGNPAFLSIARDCITDIRDLWALNKKSDDQVQDQGIRRGGVPKIQVLQAEILKLQVQVKTEQEAEVEDDE